MFQYINNFVQQRNKSHSNSECLICINRHTIKCANALEENEDKDFYVDFLGCILCKEEFKSFISLFVHIKINHEDFKCFIAQANNSDTRMKEGHLIIYRVKSHKHISFITNDDKNFCVVKDKEIEIKTIYKYLADADIHYMQNDKDSNSSIVTNSISKVRNSFASKGNTGNNIFNAKGLNLCQTTKNYKTYEDATNSGERIFFHSVTGEILNESSEDSDYEIDDEDNIKKEEKNIDQYTDICEKDKEFFKLWNRYIQTNRYHNYHL